MKNVFLLLACSFFVNRAAHAQTGIRFEADFAPSERATATVERLFRDDTCLNGSWKFMPVALGPAPDRRQLENPILPADWAWSATPIHLMLEIHHPNDQPLTVRLTSTVPAFLSTLRSAVNAPDTESISNDDANE